MPFPVAIGVGAQLLGGILGSRGAKKAAKAREQAYIDASGMIDSAYDTATGYYDPRLEQERAAMTGVNALLGLGGATPDYSLFRDAPGYQYQLEEGQRAIERSAAAGGGLVSGNTLLELQRHAQGQADTGFQNYLNTLLGVQGQGVDNVLANLAVNRGNSLADLRLGAGGARASGIEGSAAALMGGLGGAGNMLAGWGAQRDWQNFLRTAPGALPGATASSSYARLPVPGARMG